MDFMYLDPIVSLIKEKIHTIGNSKEKKRILSLLKERVQKMIDDSPFPSEKELKAAKKDSKGVLYSADGTKLIKGNPDLKSYVVKPGTKIICDRAFNDCKFLRVVILPDSLIEIGCYAFCRSGIKTIVIPDSVIEIGYGAFWYCTHLTYAALPDYFHNITSSLFVACGLIDFELPKHVKVIEDSAFASCNFTHIDIPKSVVGIHSYAFAFCKSLESVTFKGNRLEFIRKDAFKDCSSLKRIIVPLGSKDKYIQLLKDVEPDIIYESEN